MSGDPTAFPELNVLLSDCDFLVVHAGSLAPGQEAALRELHAGILEQPGYWAYNLEGSYAPVADLASLAALGRPWWYVNRGGRELERSDHDNTEDVRWVLRERPLRLTGAAPRTFACEVPADALRARMRPLLEGFVDDLRSWASFELSWTQRYAVEASSRMLYTLDWAHEALPPQWRGLIEQVRKDRFVQWNDPPRPGSVERALAYVDEVRERARSSGAHLRPLGCSR